MPTSGAGRLLVLVHLGSERTLEPVHKDGSFADKQESASVLLVVVRCECLADVERGQRRSSVARGATPASCAGCCFGVGWCVQPGPG
jgi:hypothetical protein